MKDPIAQAQVVVAHKAALDLRVVLEVWIWDLAQVESVVLAEGTLADPLE